MTDWNGFRVVAKQETEKEPVVNETNNELIEILRKTLAEAYVLYHTIHGFHWNLKGSDFYEYHKLFDEIVDDIYESIDPIAENIVKLGGVAPFVMSELISQSSIEQVGLISESSAELTRKFVEMNTKFIENLKKAFTIANDENEQGIANFIAERIDMHEKWNWFLKASLGEK
jgi:starvation-inducible DNA-binding protein